MQDTNTQTDRKPTADADTEKNLTAKLDEEGLLPSIQSIVAAHKLNIITVLLPGRGKHICRARFDIHAFLYMAGYSYPKIKGLIGQDHTTVMHGVKVGRKRNSGIMAQCRYMKAALEQLGQTNLPVVKKIYLRLPSLRGYHHKKQFLITDPDIEDKYEVLKTRMTEQVALLASAPQPHTRQIQKILQVASDWLKITHS